MRPHARTGQSPGGVGGQTIDGSATRLADRGASAGGTLRGAGGLIQTEDTASEDDAAIATYHRFLMSLRQERRHDVLSRPLFDSAVQIRLSDEQLLLISNAHHLLGHQPAVLERLRRKPSLMTSAVEVSQLERPDQKSQRSSASQSQAPRHSGSHRSAVSIHWRSNEQ